MTQLVTRKHNVRHENPNQDVEGVEIAMVKRKRWKEWLEKVGDAWGRQRDEPKGLYPFAGACA